MRTILFFGLFMSLSTVASARTVLKMADFGNVFDAVEVGPVFNGHSGLISSPIGLTVAAEAEIYRNWTWSVSSRFFQTVDERLEKTEGFYLANVDVVARDMYSLSVMGGARYYTNPTDSCWYAGGKLGFTRVGGDYEVGATEVKEVSHYVPLTLEAGHRFVVDPHFTVRVGLEIAEQFELSQQLRNRLSSDEDSFEVASIANEVPSIFNIAAGYYF